MSEKSKRVEFVKGSRAFNRRETLKLGLLGAASLAMPAVVRAEDPVLHVASLFDLTGNLNIYGIQEMNVSRYAIESINAAGGVLGKKLMLHEYDTQSKIELYSRYAQEVGANDQISAVVGCFTGASREAAPPTYGGRPSGMSPGGAYRSYSPPSAAYSGGASRASGAGGASAPTGGALHGASGSGVSRSGGGRGGGRR